MNSNEIKAWNNYLVDCKHVENYLIENGIKHNWLNGKLLSQAFIYLWNKNPYIQSHLKTICHYGLYIKWDSCYHGILATKGINENDKYINTLYVNSDTHDLWVRSTITDDYKASVADFLSLLKPMMKCTKELLHHDKGYKAIEKMKANHTDFASMVINK